MISKYIVNIGIILLIHCPGILLSQQGKEQPKPGSSSKPLELPNFIIEGKEQFDVRSGIKQFPNKPEKMSKTQLDSMNSLEKEQSLLLASEPLPSKIMNSEYKRGYLTAGFGRYSLANIEGGYGVEYQDYSFFGNAGMDYCGGHVANSDFNRFYLNLFSDYIAPDKYFIFGGSKTRTFLKIKNNNYNLYAVNPASNRNTLNFDLAINSDGSYSGFLFTAGADFHTLQLSQNIKDSTSLYAFDNLISGHLMVKNIGNYYELGGKANLDIESLRGSGVPFFEASLFGTYKIARISFNLEAGFQLGSSSQDVERAGLLISADLNYNFSELLTFKAGVFSGLRKASYFGFMNINPYLYRLSEIDFTYDIPALKGFIYFHPSELIGMSAGINIGYSERSPVFDTLNMNSGEFDLKYEKVSRIEIIGEGYWQMSIKDYLTLNTIINYTTLASNGNIVPYIPLTKISIDYKRRWYEDIFGTDFSFIYIGKRFTDYNGKDKLDGYIDLRLKATYYVMEGLALSLNIQNLLNSDIYIWKGYKERGLYFGLSGYYQFN